MFPDVFQRNTIALLKRGKERNRERERNEGYKGEGWKEGVMERGWEGGSEREKEEGRVGRKKKEPK